MPFPNPILIGSDDIILQVPKASGGNYVSTNKFSVLTLTDRPDVFKFGDLTNSFERLSDIALDTRGKPKNVYIAKNDANGSEAWELA